jgi:hypothetical protein
MPRTMDRSFQHLELHTLLDMLAEETQNYTKAFTSGALKEVKDRKTVIDALIAEIKTRKKATAPPDNLPA